VCFSILVYIDFDNKAASAFAWRHCCAMFFVKMWLFQWPTDDNCDYSG